MSGRNYSVFFVRVTFRALRLRVSPSRTVFRIVDTIGHLFVMAMSFTLLWDCGRNSHWYVTLVLECILDCHALHFLLLCAFRSIRLVL